MDPLMHVNGIKPKDILRLQIFLLLRVSLLIRMTLEIVINDAGKSSITYSSGDCFPALDACVFFVID